MKSLFSPGPPRPSKKEETSPNLWTHESVVAYAKAKKWPKEVRNAILTSALTGQQLVDLDCVTFGRALCLSVENVKALRAEQSDLQARCAHYQLLVVAADPPRPRGTSPRRRPSPLSLTTTTISRGPPQSGPIKGPVITRPLMQVVERSSSRVSIDSGDFYSPPNAPKCHSVNVPHSPDDTRGFSVPMSSFADALPVPIPVDTIGASLPRLSAHTESQRLPEAYESGYTTQTASPAMSPVGIIPIMVSHPIQAPAESVERVSPGVRLTGRSLMLMEQELMADTPSFIPMDDMGCFVIPGAPRAPPRAPSIDDEVTRRIIVAPAVTPTSSPDPVPLPPLSPVIIAPLPPLPLSAPSPPIAVTMPRVESPAVTPPQDTLEHATWTHWKIQEFTRVPKDSQTPRQSPVSAPLAAATAVTMPRVVSPAVTRGPKGRTSSPPASTHAVRPVVSATKGLPVTAPVVVPMAQPNSAAPKDSAAAPSAAPSTPDVILILGALQQLQSVVCQSSPDVVAALRQIERTVHEHHTTQIAMMERMHQRQEELAAQQRALVEDLLRSVAAMRAEPAPTPLTDTATPPKQYGPIAVQVYTGMVSSERRSYTPSYPRAPPPTTRPVNMGPVVVDTCDHRSQSTPGPPSMQGSAQKLDALMKLLDRTPGK